MFSSRENQACVGLVYRQIVLFSRTLTGPGKAPTGGQPVISICL